MGCWHPIESKNLGRNSSSNASRGLGQCGMLSVLDQVFPPGWSHRSCRSNLKSTQCGHPGWWPFWEEKLPGWWCNNHLEKYESQWEGLSHIWNGKIKKVPNHQPITMNHWILWVIILFADKLIDLPCGKRLHNYGHHFSWENPVKIAIFNSFFYVYQRVIRMSGWYFPVTSQALAGQGWIQYPQTDPPFGHFPSLKTSKMSIYGIKETGKWNGISGIY